MLPNGEKNFTALHVTSTLYIRVSFNEFVPDESLSK